MICLPYRLDRPCDQVTLVLLARSGAHEIPESSAIVSSAKQRIDHERGEHYACENDISTHTRTPGRSSCFLSGTAITCLLSNQTTMIPRITYSAVIARNVIVTFGMEVTASLVRMRW